MISGPGYFLIFVMTCWLILYTKDSMARSDSALEVQGQLSIRRSMSVVAAGVMCYLTMDTGLVTVLNTVTLATYQPFSL